MDLGCDSRWLAGALDQQINKGESRLTTRRHGVDGAATAGKANERAQLGGIEGKRPNNDCCWASEPKRQMCSRIDRGTHQRHDL